MTFICGAQSAPDAAMRILAQLRDCCAGAVLDGPTGCTCWEEVYDADQADPDETIEPVVREQMCDDCAFRPGSPERSGDDRYNHAGDLDSLSHFWCHQGMRKPVAYRHRLGITVAADTDSYQPPRRIRVDVAGGREGVPYKADGTPGDRCGGFAAYRRADGLVAAEGDDDACDDDPDGLHHIGCGH